MQAWCSFYTLFLQKKGEQFSLNMILSWEQFLWDQVHFIASTGDVIRKYLQKYTYSYEKLSHYNCSKVKYLYRTEHTLYLDKLKFNDYTTSMLTNSGDCHSQAEAKQTDLETLTSSLLKECHSQNPGLP